MKKIFKFISSHLIEETVKKNNPKIIKKLILLFFISTPAFAASLPSPEIATIVQGSSAKAYKYKLKNGLQLIIVPDMRNPVATLHFLLDAGSNRETYGTTGLAHFFEHNMFRKTKEAPEGNYDRVLNSVGGKGNAGTSDSFVTFYSTFPAPAIEPILKLESDRFMHLDIADPYFSTEKGAVISERKLRVENDPLQRSQEILRAISERETPLEWMTIGSKADVENMSLNAALDFYKKYYTPDNTVIILGGPFKPDEAYSLIKKYFGNWTGTLTEKHKPYLAKYFTRDLGKSFICSANVFTKQYQIIYPSSQSNIESLVYSTLFQAMLDNNKEGTFKRRLVKEKLATNFVFYQPYWQYGTSPYIANFSLTSEQSFDKLKDFWLNNIKNVMNQPLTQKVKDQVLKQLAVSNAESTEKLTELVNSVIDNIYFLKDFHAAGKMEKIVNKTTDKEFHNWLKKYLNNKNFFIKGIEPASSSIIPCSDYKPDLK